MLPQRFVFSGIYELPFAATQKTHCSEEVAKGWQLNGIVTFQAGQPVNVYANTNASQQDNYLDRPNVVGPSRTMHQPRNSQQTFIADCNGTSDGSETGNFWFNPTNLVCSAVRSRSLAPMPLASRAFRCLPMDDLPRNYIRGPGINNWDLSITKQTALKEHTSLEFRAEFFNAFNHVQFLRVDNGGYTSPTFGQVIFRSRDAPHPVRPEALFLRRI